MVENAPKSFVGDSAKSGNRADSKKIYGDSGQKEEKKEEEKVVLSGARWDESGMCARSNLLQTDVLVHAQRCSVPI